MSEAVRGVLASAGLDRARLHVVRSGVDPALLRPRRSREEVRREMGVSPEDLLVGGVGALAPHKDHATWVEAAAIVVSLMPSARFVLAGEGALRDELARRISRHRSSDRIQLLGFREDVPDLLGAFDVFFHSSRLEGLGTALIDASFAGLPIVATRVGGVPEVARQDENALLARAGDVPALADALVSILSDPARRERMREASRGIAEEFHADRTATDTLRVYEEVLRSDGVGG